MVTTLIMLCGLIIYGVLEFRHHQRKVSAIPIRILVNGTRGKSSVTRLITAGLRGGGMRVMGKTTGTAPRVIFPDGSEKPITRLGRANIIEQVKVVRAIASHSVDAMVTECMAVMPPNQTIMEHQMIHSTIGVITNAREDHLDEMGPTVADVATALSNTVPCNAHLYTSERIHLSRIETVAAQRNTVVHLADGATVTDEEIARFSYVEHKENVALALAVCVHLGINRTVALEAMYQAEPDPGVLRIYHVCHYDKNIEFVNAFAANDPDSYVLIWSLLANRLTTDKKVIVIANCRKDRVQRTESMAELVACKLRAHHFVFAGEYTTALVTRAMGLGLAKDRILSLAGASGEDIFNKIAALTDSKSIVIGIGNIVGFGDELVNSFKCRGKEIEY